MVTDAPERTLEQRMTALKGANVIRSARAQLKKDIKAGRRSALTCCWSRRSGRRR
jgi:hypothetical protein